MTNDPDNTEWGIDRRTVLKGAAVGAGIAGMPGLASAGSGRGGDRPCFKDFECSDGAAYVKFEFVIEYDDDGNIVDCYFEEETDTHLITIDIFHSKDGDECEPIVVEWSVADGYVATKAMAYGGQGCVSADYPDPDESFEPGLEGAGGQTAAISNLQFCVKKLEEVCVDGLEGLEADDEIDGQELNGVTVTSPDGNTIVAAEEGKEPAFYGAPNGGGSTFNGCMGEKVDVGFGDINAQNDGKPQDLDFGFGAPVREFELRMLDYGDFNPNGGEYHLVEIMAYDGDDKLVDSETIEYWTDSKVNPNTAYKTSAKEEVLWDNLYKAGDACDAEAGQPGDYTFKLAGGWIERVELRFGAGHDPNIAFDLPCVEREVEIY